MENLEVLVRGVAMQSSGGPGGLNLPRSVTSFQGLELLWVVIVATIVLAVMSVTRQVSVLTWGWSKSGSHVRVRVQSFASLADGAAGGMFSAEIVHSSADSCSEDASSNSSTERAEIHFIFNENGASLMTTTTTLPLSPSAAPPRLHAPDSKVTRLPIVQEFQKPEVLVASTPQPGFPRREGIQWDVNALSVGSLLPVATPVVYRVPSRVVRNASSSEWDPILKLRIRDAVLSDGGSFTVPLVSPVAAIQGSGVVTMFKDDVVRAWDCDSKELMKSVHLGYGGVPTAFDVNWGEKVAAMAREGGVVSIANLESGVYEECYQTQQRVVQAIHLDSSLSPNTVFTGGPSGVNPGCSVSIWDCRSSSWELSVSLATAITIDSLHSRGPELCVRDEAGSVAAHDVRMLGASPVSRQPCDVVTHATQDRWWDIDTGFQGNQDDEDDCDDDFFDCEERQAAGASYMGQSFVRAVSFNFSTKPASH